LDPLIPHLFEQKCNFLETFGANRDLTSLFGHTPGSRWAVPTVSPNWFQVLFFFGPLVKTGFRCCRTHFPINRRSPLASLSRKDNHVRLGLVGLEGFIGKVVLPPPTRSGTKKTTPSVPQGRFLPKPMTVPFFSFPPPIQVHPSTYLPFIVPHTSPLSPFWFPFTRFIFFPVP